MIRRSHRGMAILLTVALLVGMMPTMAFAGIRTCNLKPYRYVSIGASNVNGYGLRGYIDDENMEKASLDQDVKKKFNVFGYKRAPKDAYPARIQEALEEKLKRNVELDQLAISSMRVEELRCLLDDTYEPDVFNKWRFTDGHCWFDMVDGKYDNGNWDSLKQEYRESISSADLITVDIGMNNFGAYLSYMIGNSDTNANDLSRIDPKIGKKYKALKNVVENLLDKYAGEIGSTELTSLVDTLAYALIGFCYNFDKSMEKIYELNPDAKIVVVSIQSVFTGVSIKIDDIKIPLGDILGSIINTANLYMATQSPYADRYRIADVRNSGRVEFFIDEIAEYESGESQLSQNMIDCFNVYDGDLGTSYDDSFHIMYMLDKYLKSLTPPLAGKDLEEQMEKLLPVAYDAFAQMLSAFANYKVLDYSVLNEYQDAIKVMPDAIKEELLGAVRSAAAEPSAPYVFSADDFCGKIKGYSKDLIMSVGAVAVRIELGNSFFGHPTPNGHKEIADTILKVLETEKSGNGQKVARTAIEKFADEIYEIIQTDGADTLMSLVNGLEADNTINKEQADTIRALIDHLDKLVNSKQMDAAYTYSKKIAKLLDKYACAYKEFVKKYKQLKECAVQHHQQRRAAITQVVTRISKLNAAIQNMFSRRLIQKER